MAAAAAASESKVAQPEVLGGDGKKKVATEDAAKGELGEFDQAMIYWNAEVAIILEARLGQIDSGEVPDADKASNRVLHQTLDYARDFNNYRSKDAIQAARA